MSKETLYTKKKTLSTEEKKKRLSKRYEEFSADDITIRHAWLNFQISQEEKGNSKATIQYYKNCYVKFQKYLQSTNTTDEELPVSAMMMEGFTLGYRLFLEKEVDKKGNPLNTQTINTYLRAHRSFGNFCEKKGFIEGFECPIKETATPIKQVYTEEEIKKLVVKPSSDNFTEYRNYLLIVVLLSTGARCNTLLNIRIQDVDLEEGNIIFNTTKAGKVVRVPLERKAKRDLKEYIFLWRSGKDTKPDDFLFCNWYGEQLTRGGITKAIKEYNLARGVEKTSIHLFRHTFAKRWIQSGGDIFTLKQILTHSELTMVERYLNIYGSDLEEAVNNHSVLSQMRTRSGETILQQRTTSGRTMKRKNG